MADLSRFRSRFRVGGLDDESEKPTEPVQVICTRCGNSSPWFTFRDDGGADRTAPLDELVAWAQEHRCLRDDGD
jgi:hypothetical protein